MEAIRQPSRTRHWEQAGIIVGIILVAANWLAVGTEWLSGPIFHPVWIVLGFGLCFACFAFLAGANRDQYDIA